MVNEELKRAGELYCLVIAKDFIETGTRKEYYPHGGNTKVGVEVYEVTTGYEKHRYSFGERNKAKKELSKILRNTSDIKVEKYIRNCFRKFWVDRLKFSKDIIVTILVTPILLLWGIVSVSLFLLGILLVIVIPLAGISLFVYMIYLLIAG